jgi:hypothetical protein
MIHPALCLHARPQSCAIRTRTIARQVVQAVWSRAAGAAVVQGECR